VAFPCIPAVHFSFAAGTMEKIEKGISELKDVFQALQLEKERLEAQQKLLEVEKQKMAVSVED
jgi:hypothetical protein